MSDRDWPTFALGFLRLKRKSITTRQRSSQCCLRVRNEPMLDTQPSPEHHIAADKIACALEGLARDST